jgi:hypothetical protein
MGTVVAVGTVKVSDGETGEMLGGTALCDAVRVGIAEHEVRMRVKKRTLRTMPSIWNLQLHFIYLGNAREPANVPNT